MNQEATREVTDLLRAHQAGDRQAFDRLMPLVYHQLKHMAHRQVGGGAATPTLDTTALVHEAYEKLVDQARIPWQSRGHFFAIAARAMRQIVVDYARERAALKRGGDRVQIPFDEASLSVDAEAGLLLDLERSLDELTKRNQRLARLIECRFFTGLSEAEAAEALNVSVRTVQREWAKARAWLALQNIPVSNPTN